MIKSNGGVFGRNPTFQDVTVDGNLTVNGDLALGDDITINDTLLVNGVATFKGGIVSTGTAAAPISNTVMGSGAGAALQAGGTDNTLIGTGAGSAITTQTNVVSIGANAVSNGSNTTTIGNSSTTGTFIPAGNFNVQGTEASSSPTTGAVRVSGGIGAAGQITTSGDFQKQQAAAQGIHAPAAFSLSSQVSTTYRNLLSFGDANRAGLLSVRHDGANSVNWRLSRTGSAAADIIDITSTTASNAVVKLNSAVASTSTTTGALVVSGGVGIAGAVYPGGNVVMASGQGIDFSATTDGSGTMTSELLNDYEEGTFTPTVTGGVTNVTYGAQLGWYVKIGTMVYFQLYMDLDSPTVAAATQFKFGGLPFASASSSTTGVSGAYWAFCQAGTAITGLAIPYISNNSTEVLMYSQSGAIYNGTDFADVLLGMRIAGMYRTS